MRATASVSAALPHRRSLCCSTATAVRVLAWIKIAICCLEMLLVFEEESKGVAGFGTVALVSLGVNGLSIGAAALVLYAAARRRGQLLWPQIVWSAVTVALVMVELVVLLADPRVEYPDLAFRTEQQRQSMLLSVAAVYAAMIAFELCFVIVVLRFRRLILEEKRAATGFSVTYTTTGLDRPVYAYGQATLGFVQPTPPPVGTELPSYAQATAVAYPVKPSTSAS